MHFELPPSWPRHLSSDPTAQLPANLETQLLRYHIAHKEGEHLAPHGVLAAGTGLGTEGERPLKGLVGQSRIPVRSLQPPGTSGSHLCPWSDPHTLVGGIRVEQPDLTGLRVM